MPGPTSAAMRSATESSGSQDLPILAIEFTWLLDFIEFQHCNTYRGQGDLELVQESFWKALPCLQPGPTLRFAPGCDTSHQVRVFLRVTNGPSTATYSNHLSSSSHQRLLKSLMDYMRRSAQLTKASDLGLAVL